MNKLVAAGLVFAITGAAAPAMAQGLSPVTSYGTLGYSHFDLGGSSNVEALTGRLGAKFGRYVGVEGEGSFGVDGDKATIGGVQTETKLRRAFAGYVVGTAPLSPNFELFGRIGYGTNKYRVETGTTRVSASADSWNYGGGGQYFFDGKNGLRAEYTRHDYTKGRGKDDVWGVSYVRRF